MSNSSQKRDREVIDNEEKISKKLDIEDKEFKPPPLLSKHNSNNNNDSDNSTNNNNNRIGSFSISKPLAKTSKPAFGGISFNFGKSSTTSISNSNNNNNNNNNNSNDNSSSSSTTINKQQINITYMNNPEEDERKEREREEKETLEKEKEESEKNNKENVNSNNNNNNNKSTTNIVVGPPKPLISTTVGPPRPSTSTVGPPRPSATNNNDSDSDSSDSDDSDSDSSNENSKINNNNNNNNLVGPPRPSTSTTNIVVGPPRPSTSTTVGPPRPSNNNNNSNSSDDSDSSNDSDDSDEEKEEIERWKSLVESLPISHEVIIKGHHRPVSAISLDPNGSRMLTGSYDGKVKFWDFNGMDKSLQSFREIEPVEGNQVRATHFNQTGDQFIVVPYTTQIRLYDRDGHFQEESISGDRFIRDLNKTKGHTGTLSGACWHPNEKDEIITSSLDGTIRVWDINSITTKNQSVIKSKPSKGDRIAVSNCVYDQRGDIITGGLEDGTISMWDKRSTLTKPKTELNNAHAGQVISIQYNRDCYSMISRSMDHSLKVWDLRNISKSNSCTPIAVWDDLQCEYAETNCIFGSFDRVIVTGTSSAKGGFGTIVMYDLASLTKMRQIRVDNDVSVINCNWNEKLNQLFFGCSDGITRGYYDPTTSTKGLKLCATKAPRIKNVSDYEPLDRPIITPNSLPLFKTSNPKKDRKKSKPEQQAERTSAKGPNLTQHLIKHTGLTNNTSWKEDARDSFLRAGKQIQDEKDEKEKKKQQQQQQQ